MEKHTYCLQRYQGLKSRHTCPSCDGKHCFTLYVDENGDPLNEMVGRCDHESGCGYHYTPKQFFADNPSARPTWEENFFRVPQPQVPKVKKEPCTISTDILNSSVNPGIESDFTLFLTGLFGVEVTHRIVRDYLLGVTKKRDVVFFQVDKDGRCRTGKIMKYNRETGHRIKDENVGGKITWVHSVLKRSENPKLRLPDSWELSQCLFGEHLLKRYPFKNVALVESEKTAVICSAFWPEYIWLATGGKSQLNNRLEVLKGRKIIAFPDVDGYREWKEKIFQIRGIDITVSDILEKNATAEERAAHVDIADLLIRQHQKEFVQITPEEKRNPMENPNFLKVKELFGGENLEELANLIEELELEVVGISKA